ncbi:MAG: hypothetical protein ACLFWL_14245 [Candidatus Brocadiia bacterium]
MTRTRRLILLSIAFVAIVAASLFVEPLHRNQVEYDLTSEPVEGVGAEYAFVNSLGAFRGIVVDVVWIRMENLKNDGKFFEIVQLADLACMLAPRFPKAWDFNAWNMAYNVSVQVPEYSERWPWVKAGIELLRDQGIPNNPSEPELYFSLAWIFLHKVGDQLDDAHAWYKQQLGVEMHEVLGGGGSPEKLKRLKNAPATRADLFQDDRVKEFYEKLVAAGWDPLKVVSDEGLRQYFLWLRRPDSVPEPARGLLKSEGYAREHEKLADYVRARRLEDMNMEPEKMLELMDRFGPLDWRSPYSNGIYWASEGKEVAQRYRERVSERRKVFGKEEIADEDWGSEFPKYRYADINYDRVIYGALQSLVSKGRLLFDSQGRLFPMPGSDYRFTDAMIEHFERMVGKYGKEGRYSTGINSAYENFLKRVTTEFYYMGDEKDSRRYYKRLRQEYPKDKYPPSYEKFINAQMREYIGMLGPQQARNVVRGLLVQHYLFLGAGIDDRARGFIERAKAIAERWNVKRGVKEDPRASQKVTFSDIRRSVLIDIFAGRYTMPKRIMNGLKEQLPEKLVEKMEKAADEREEPSRLKPFELPEKYRREPD